MPFNRAGIQVVRRETRVRRLRRGAHHVVSGREPLLGRFDDVGGGGDVASGGPLSPKQRTVADRQGGGRGPTGPGDRARGKGRSRRNPSSAGAPPASTGCEELHDSAQLEVRDTWNRTHLPAPSSHH